MTPQERQEIQQIATQVYQKLGSRFGVNQTPVHYHDEIGSPNLPPTSLTNAETLSAVDGGVLIGKTVTNLQPPMVVFPIPIFTSVPTGIAPEGTLALVNGISPGLYARVSSAWVYIGPYIPPA